MKPTWRQASGCPNNRRMPRPETKPAVILVLMGIGFGFQRPIIPNRWRPGHRTHPDRRPRIGGYRRRFECSRRRFGGYGLFADDLFGNLRNRAEVDSRRNIQTIVTRFR